MNKNKSQRKQDLSKLIAQKKTESNVKTAEVKHVYEFASEAQWPDEQKSQLERKHRRMKPVEGNWILLGNGETWLIPHLEMLTADICVHEKKNYLGRITYRFTTEWKRWGELRRLMAVVFANQVDENLSCSWEDAYLVMVFALQANYTISTEEMNRVGLLREEHVLDILLALSGSKKKMNNSE